MGHGAPKKYDTIPVSQVVTILAWEGLVREAFDNLSDAVKECLDGSENPYYWTQMEKWRSLLVDRNRQYSLALLRLGQSQDKG